MKNLIDRFNAYPRLHRVVFLLSLVIAISPILYFKWVITLDGPWHLYNAVIEDRLFSGDHFSATFFEHNPEVVSNYTTHYLLFLLLQLFNAATALKIFHIILVLVLFIGFNYWNQTLNYTGRLFVSSIATLGLLSLLFTSGFYNFILGIGLMFITLGYYERKQLRNWLFYIRLFALLGLIYFTHSLVFGLTGIFLGIFILFNEKLNRRTLIELGLLLISGLPYIILTIVFMQSRGAELWYIPKGQLLTDLLGGNGIYARGETSKMLLHLFLMSSLVIVISRIILKETKDHFLLLSSLLLLLLYFFTPDSFGYAGVFSIRYNYLFWFFLFAWIIRNPFKKTWINSSFVLLSLIVLSFKTTDMFRLFYRLDKDTKELITACEVLPKDAVVVPIFASNTWEHFHISNILGTQYNILILENNGARNDYFPIRYTNNFEDRIKLKQTIDSNKLGIAVTHMVRIGNESVDFDHDKMIYNLFSQSSHCIHKTKQFEVWEVTP